MLKDEYNRLIKLFKNAEHEKVANLDPIFTQAIELFERLKEQITHGTPEEQEEALHMLNDLHAQMILEAKRLTEKSGFSEEQLIAFSENPSNFSPEQWKTIQDSKNKIAEASQGIAQIFQDLDQKEIPDTKEGTKKKKHKGKTSKKSQWMRS